MLCFARTCGSRGFSIRRWRGANQRGWEDKKRAERQFNWQAIREAVERMRPELIAASEAAHKAKESELDEAEPELDRTLELGYLVDCLGGTAVLSEIAQALDELHDAGSDRVPEKTPPH